jgi:hypothetical protein
MSMHELPPDLHALLAGGTWRTISSGASGTQVYRIARPLRNLNRTQYLPPSI